MRAGNIPDNAARGAEGQLVALELRQHTLCSRLPDLAFIVRQDGRILCKREAGFWAVVSEGCGGVRAEGVDRGRDKGAKGPRDRVGGDRTTKGPGNHRPWSWVAPDCWTRDTRLGTSVTSASLLHGGVCRRRG